MCNYVYTRICTNMIHILYKLTAVVCNSAWQILKSQTVLVERSTNVIKNNLATFIFSKPNACPGFTFILLSSSFYLASCRWTTNMSQQVSIEFFFITIQWQWSADTQHLFLMQWGTGVTMMFSLASADNDSISSVLA